jgi:hypothetical protein
VKKPDMTTRQLDENQIREALEKSGYPLEIRLRKVFAEAGLNPKLGSLRATDAAGEELHEIDLTLERVHDVKMIGTTADVGIHAFVAAKKLPEGSALVGIVADDERLLEPVQRPSFAGDPAWPRPNSWSGSGRGALFTGTQGLVNALHGFFHAPICAIQTRVTMNENGSKVSAAGDAVYFKALSDTVRAIHFRDLRFTASMRRGGGVHIRYFHPALVVETNHLYVYSVHDRSLKSVPRFILVQEFDAKDGSAILRPIEIVRADGAQEFADRLHAAAEAFAERTTAHLPHLYRETRTEPRDELDDDER